MFLFLENLICHIQERLSDTCVFAAFSVLDPLQLPGSVEDAESIKCGESQLKTLERQYSCGDLSCVNASSLEEE